MDTNNQEREMDVYGTIGELQKSGAGKEIISIAKKDMDFGVDKDVVLWYGESGWSAERVREFSNIIKNTTDQAFIDFIRNGDFTETQMGILLEFHKKGIPLEKLAELMGQDMTPYALKNALSGIYKDMQQADTKTGGAEFEEIKRQVGSLAENISRNQKFYESVSEQLKKLSDSKADADEVRAELYAEISQKEKMMEDQQDNLNKAVTENAVLRAEKTALENEVKRLKETAGKAAQHEAEAERLRKEKASLASELAKTKERLEQAKAELIKEEEKHAVSPGNRQGAAGKEKKIMEDYQTVIHAGGGDIPGMVEHMKTADRDGLFAMLGKKLFGNKKQMQIIKAAAGAGLDKEQMKQVTRAIREGLAGNEVIDIIHAGFDAGEMEQAIEIVLAEKSYE